MASLFEQFSTNRKFETEGVIIDMGEGTSFRIARRSKANKRYTKALEAATKPHQIAIEKETMSAELSDEIMLDVFCKTILLGWTGVKFDDRLFPDGFEGEPIDDHYVPFSEKNAKALMTAIPDLYDELNKASNKFSNFREAADKDDAKN